MTPERLAAIRAQKEHTPVTLLNERFELLAEIDRLAGEVTRWHRHNEEVVKMERAAVGRAEEAERQRDALAAVLNRVEELIIDANDALDPLEKSVPTWRDAPPRVADGEGSA